MLCVESTRREECPKASCPKRATVRPQSAPRSVSYACSVRLAVSPPHCIHYVNLHSRTRTPAPVRPPFIPFVKSLHASATLRGSSPASLGRASPSRTALAHERPARNHCFPLLAYYGLHLHTQIACRLVVNPSTNKSDIGNILAKLGLTSRTGAVTLALGHKLSS
jgi:hypothetical protein